MPAAQGLLRRRGATPMRSTLGALASAPALAASLRCGRPSCSCAWCCTASSERHGAHERTKNHGAGLIKHVAVHGAALLQLRCRPSAVCMGTLVDAQHRFLASAARPVPTYNYTQGQPATPELLASAAASTSYAQAVCTRPPVCSGSVCLRASQGPGLARQMAALRPPRTTCSCASGSARRAAPCCRCARDTLPQM